MQVRDLHDLPEIAKPHCTVSPSAFVLQVPNEVMSRVIGKNGENIRALSFLVKCKIAAST